MNRPETDSPSLDPEAVAELYGAALDLPDEERGPFLASATADRPRLRAEVESLLAAHREAASFLSRSPASRAASAAESPLAAGTRIGAYRVLSEIGRGGMGAVYLAERADGAFEQRVALKLIRRGIGSAAMRERFVRERQILARLDHDNIARLLDGGVTDDGWPYFAMELVHGTPLLDFCDSRRMSVSGRLGLLQQACGAVQHAHSNLVVHRDLKPSNMLVTAEGVLKLLDFGIARVLSQDDEGTTPLTRAGFHPLTPEYAAPEQLRGEPATTAADIYVLGAVLFELLTGRRHSRIGGPAGRETDFLSPSAVVTRPHGGGKPGAAETAELAARRGMTPKGLRRQLAGDLEAIVQQALQPDPARRYATVEALGEDLRRFLSGAPVRARSATLGYRIGKALRRHRVASAAALAAVLSLLGGLAASLWQARVAEHERDRAAAAASEAKAVAAYLVDLFRDVDPEQGAGAELSARELLDRGAARLDATLADRPLVRARLLEAIGSVYRSNRQLDPASRLLEAAVAERERAQGTDHPDLASPLLELAAVHYRAARYSEARVVLERVLALAEAHEAELQPERIRALTLLGNLHLGESNWAAAEAAYRRALAELDGKAGTPAPDRTPVLNNLGVAIFSQGRLDEAETIHRRLLEELETRPGGDPTGVARSLVNLSMVARARGDAAQSGDLAERALAIRERMYGRDHPAIAEALDLRAESRIALGHGSDAEEDRREALRIRTVALGLDHPETALSTLELARLLADLGRPAEAIPLAESAALKLDSLEGADPGDLLRARALLAELGQGSTQRND